jgi:polyisoprenoid-binding protein YceI
MIYLKTITCCLFILSGLTLHAQKKFAANNGEVNFTSNSSLELIKASSKDIQGLIDPATGQFAFVVKIQSFIGFNTNLQREHFNEKYMETDKYYNATFSGKIIEDIDFTKDGVYEVRAKGNLVIHGKKQARIIPSKIKIEKGVLKIDSHFTIPLADHDIKVPQVISQKIASEIIVDLIILMAQK